MEALNLDSLVTEFPTDEDFMETSGLFKALAHPLRLKLVCWLLKSARTQTSISKEFGLPQSSVAQQLGVLRRAGIVRGRRAANEVLLEVSHPRIAAVLVAACKHR